MSNEYVSVLTGWTGRTWCTWLRLPGRRLTSRAGWSGCRPPWPRQRRSRSSPPRPEPSCGSCSGTPSRTTTAPRSSTAGSPAGTTRQTCRRCLTLLELEGTGVQRFSISGVYNSSEYFIPNMVKHRLQVWPRPSPSYGWSPSTLAWPGSSAPGCGPT